MGTYEEVIAALQAKKETNIISYDADNYFTMDINITAVDRSFGVEEIRKKLQTHLDTYWVYKPEVHVLPIQKQGMIVTLTVVVFNPRLMHSTYERTLEKEFQKPKQAVFKQAVTRRGGTQRYFLLYPR